MAICPISESSMKKIRRIPVRNDLVDITCYADGTEVQVFATFRLIQRFKRLGQAEAVAKLRRMAARGILVLKHNHFRKSNFIVDLVPEEFFTVERYYGEGNSSLIIDCEPLYAVEQLQQAVNG
jgi:hypothetical protein